MLRCAATILTRTTVTTQDHPEQRGAQHRLSTGPRGGRQSHWCTLSQNPPLSSITSCPSAALGFGSSCIGMTEVPQFMANWANMLRTSSQPWRGSSAGHPRCCRQRQCQAIAAKGGPPGSPCWKGWGARATQTAEHLRPRSPGRKLMPTRQAHALSGVFQHLRRWVRQHQSQRWPRTFPRSALPRHGPRATG
jgi:hypothetical protein